MPNGLLSRLDYRRAEKDDMRYLLQPHEFSALLKATKRGTKDGDILGLAIASGCRADELATLSTGDVHPSGSDFTRAQGQTDNEFDFMIPPCPCCGNNRAASVCLIRTGIGPLKRCAQARRPVTVGFSGINAGRSRY
jgi:hypothetical protein